MRKLLFFIGIIIFFSFLAFAQDYEGKARIQGIVTDEEGKPLKEVKVKLFCLKTESGFETVTDAKGEWKANWIRGGSWNIDFEKLGYNTKPISVVVSELKRSSLIKVEMKKTEGLLVSDKLKEDVKKGEIFYEEGKYEEAIEVFNVIINTFPDAYIINMSIGNCYFKMEDYSRAEEYYLKVLEKDSKNSDAITAIGNCYSNREDNAKALEWYKKIEIEKIDDPVVLYNVGTYFYNNSQIDEALKYYREAVGIKKDFLDGIYQLGLAHLALGNNAEALNSFENYLEYDPDSERASRVKGFIEFLKIKINE